jgi:hypothetical protein
VISPEASWFVRRLVAVLVSAWLGGILMVALSAPAAFQSVDFSLKSPPPSMLKAVKLLGEPAVHEILRFQVGEANRLMFETWGTVQLILSAAAFILLLFFSTVRRTTLGVSLIMLATAALMKFLLIPRIVETGRTLHTSAPGSAAKAAESFRALHVGFSAFESAVAVLGVLLLALLLRNRRGSRSSSRNRRHTDPQSV